MSNSSNQVKFPPVQVKSAIIPMIISAAILMMAIDYSITGSWHSAPYYIAFSFLIFIVVRLFKAHRNKQDSDTYSEKAPVSVNNDIVDF